MKRARICGCGKAADVIDGTGCYCAHCYLDRYYPDRDRGPARETVLHRTRNAQADHLPGPLSRPSLRLGGLWGLQRARTSLKRTG